MASDISKQAGAVTRSPDEEALREARKGGRGAREGREAAQRKLLAGAMTRAAAAVGYEACRVEDVIELAGLSRATFYKHFRNKEECFLAAFEAAVESMLERAKEATAGEATAVGRAEAGVLALVELLAAEPAVARLAMIEVRTMGSAGQEPYERAVERFAELVVEAGGKTADGVAQLIVGAVASAISREVAEGRAGELKELVGELVFTVVAPCLGSEAALAAIGRCRQA